MIFGGWGRVVDDFEEKNTASDIDCRKKENECSTNETEKKSCTFGRKKKMLQSFIIQSA